MAIIKHHISSAEGEIEGWQYFTVGHILVWWHQSWVHTLTLCFWGKCMWRKHIFEFVATLEALQSTTGSLVLLTLSPWPLTTVQSILNARPHHKAQYLHMPLEFSSDRCKVQLNWCAEAVITVFLQSIYVSHHYCLFTTSKVIWDEKTDLCFKNYNYSQFQATLKYVDKEIKKDS